MMKALSVVEPPAASSSVPVDSKVGVLIEIRFIGSASLDQVVAFEKKLVTLVRRIAKDGRRRAVLCTDLRACLVLRPEVSDRIVKLMQNDNPHIERNAFLGQTSALLSLQVQRFISESGERGRRRMFAEEAPLVTWLSEVTTIHEQARLRAFLASAPVVSV
jgi:hypothetical protein